MMDKDSKYFGDAAIGINDEKELMKFINENFETIENERDLLDFIQKYIKINPQTIQKNFDSWTYFIFQNMRRRGLSMNKMAQAIDVKNVNNVIARYIKKIPPVRYRNYVISFAVLFDFDVDETDYMLKSKARMQELYVKDIEDAIWIFIISKNRNLPKDKKYKRPLKLFEELKESLEKYIALDSEYFEKRKTRKSTINYVESKDTDIIRQEIISLADEEEFIAYIEEHFPDFRSRNQKLIAELESKEIVPSGDYPHVPKFREWYNKHRQSIIKGKRPDRSFLIVLGLMNDCKLSVINEWLELAHMSPLHPKSLFEFLLIHYLNVFYKTGDYSAVFEQAMEEIIYNFGYEDYMDFMMELPLMKKSMRYYKELISDFTEEENDDKYRRE